MKNALNLNLARPVANRGWYMSPEKMCMGNTGTLTISGSYHRVSMPSKTPPLYKEIEQPYSGNSHILTGLVIVVHLAT